MTLEKAIKELEQSNPDFGNFREAIRLGIEALKRIKEGRGGYTKEIVNRLPSETLED